MVTLAELISRYSTSGKLIWIGTRPARRQPMITHSKIMVDEKGLVGDRTTRPSNRSITLVQQEHLAAIASLSNQSEISPEALRRNLVVGGINLLALKDQRFQIGDVLFQGTGICAPCSRMEETLGNGGYNAVRGHGGITAKVLQIGTISIGDTVIPVSSK
jgi:MOSC domain-containing protein YiiM